ncbi:MAG: DUF4391 domain-containing protein [Desulfobacterales bacterium]|nr:DUF4391 domain-containing protein [Desulfobacterales bacterium]MDD4071494.1 DUF4391 domain-containing protein [Desulfobacterales bacterium]MDD4392935.1 DUF4391 domain-containing protein [Desulfobacterales bacterium]
MSFLYDFPKKAAFGKVLPKSKIYEHASPTPSVKDLFIREVDKIVWSYKLSPETVNLPAKGSVQEIQVFTIALKTGTLKHEVLQTIDKAIPSPILFALSFEHKIRYIAAYKRRNEADMSKWVVSGYFETNWMPDDTGRIVLPVVLDLGALYSSMLENIIPLPSRQNETIDELVSRVEKLRLKEREAVKAAVRLKKKKQFNRRVEINAELRGLKQEIEALKI